MNENEITSRKKAVCLWLQGVPKSEIARRSAGPGRGFIAGSATTSQTIQRQAWAIGLGLPSAPIGNTRRKYGNWH